MNDISRRGLMRKGALTTAAAVGVGAGANHAGYSPVGRAQAIAPYIAVAGAAAGLSYMAYDYVENSGLNFHLGDSRDYGGYTNKSTLADELFLGAKKMASADERVQTSIENNIANSENIALTKGKAAAIEQMNAGAGESTATTAMQDAVNAYYTTIQKNIITHWNAQYDQVVHHLEEVLAHPNTSDSEGGQNMMLTASNSYGWYNLGSTRPTVTATYADGSTGAIRYFKAAAGGFSQFNAWPYQFNPTNIAAPSGEAKSYYVDYRDSSGNSQIWDPRKFGPTWEATFAEKDAVLADLSGFVSDIYANYNVGEIPTADLVDPITAATQFGQDYDNTTMRSAQAAMLGIPTQNTRSLTLEIHTDGDATTDGSIFKADLFTTHVPTDGSGNEIGFTTGTLYEPSTWTKPAYIAYESQETDSDGVITDTKKDFVELAKPFEVIEAVSSDGSTVDSFQVEETNNQTAQISELQNEIDQLNQTLADQREKQEELATGGGGGFLAGSNIGTPGLLAAGGAVLLAAFGLSGGS